MKLKDLASQFTSLLSTIYEKDEVQAIFLIVIDNLLNYNRIDFLVKKEEVLSIEKLASLQQVLAELQTGKPIQYILGETFFYGLPFKVNPSVLIPRPETEELVEWILELSKNQLLAKNNNLNILDIGTGSGCIAIALKKNIIRSKVWALDIAKESLAIAQKNATLNNVEIEFIESDILKNFSFLDRYELIISNPPYITETEKLAMHPNVLDNEPHRALFVSNEKPLIFYEAIAEFSLKHLTPNGFLFFEINEYLAKETIAMLATKGFNNIELRKDMQGKDRMVKANL